MSLLPYSSINLILDFVSQLNNRKDSTVIIDETNGRLIQIENKYHIYWYSNVCQKIQQNPTLIQNMLITCSNKYLSEYVVDCDIRLLSSMPLSNYYLNNSYEYDQINDDDHQYINNPEYQDYMDEYNNFMEYHYNNYINDINYNENDDDAYNNWREQTESDFLVYYSHIINDENIKTNKFLNTYYCSFQYEDEDGNNIDNNPNNIYYAYIYIVTDIINNNLCLTKKSYLWNNNKKIGTIIDTKLFYNSSKRFPYIVYEAIY